MHDSVTPQSMHVHGFINIEGISPTDLLYAELVVHSHPGLLQATASDLHDAAGVESLDQLLDPMEYAPQVSCRRDC
jgi:hypothetical protein